MAEIGVLHPDLTVMGGGESVCMNVLDSLQDEHSLSLYTLSDPDFDSLNEYYNTYVNDVEVIKPRIITNILGISEKLVYSAMGRSTILFQTAVLSRVADNGGHDLIINTYKEYGFKTPAIQYIHYPRRAISRENLVLDIYDYLCGYVSGGDKKDIESGLLLANSNWTADVTKEYYDTTPEVVYPPVDSDEFNSQLIDWDDREPGFVIIGRVVPDKNILDLIEIVGELWRRNKHIHCHIIGPSSNQFQEYSQTVKDAAANREYVFFEGKLPRDEMIDMICTHKYGLHGRPNEHFGIVIAEMVAGGVIPFVPNDGGQIEIVGGETRLIYNSKDEAVRKIEDVISGSGDPSQIRAELPDIDDKFGPNRFSNQLRSLVNRTLSENNV